MRLNELLAYDDIVIQCHNFPDADTLAAGYGVYVYLKSHGKNPLMIYGGDRKITKPNLLLMLDRLEIPIKYVKELHTPEALVTVDCCYGEGNVERFEAKNIFVIDHHSFGSECPYRSEIKSNYSSCSTIIAQMLSEENFDRNSDKELATALYFGLYSDSNGMNEINHPADRDLRDLTDIDTATVILLKNSNLSPDEMKIAGDALKHCKYDYDLGFAVVETMPCDPNILGFISDLLLQVDKVNICVVFCKRPFGIKLSVRSCTNDIRANELVEYIVADNGSGGGHAQKAGGYMRDFSPEVNAVELVRKRVIEYCKSFEIIYASEFNADVSSMKKYIKNPLKVGYVRSTDILGAGAKICVRTLEGDINLCTAEDLYIMVGVRGEIYPIRKEKFLRSYKPLDEPFLLHADYVPSIIDKSKSLNTQPCK